MIYQCGSVGWVLTHKAKGHWFHSWSRAWAVGSVLVGAPMKGNLIDVSLTLFLPPFPSL